MAKDDVGPDHNKDDSQLIREVHEAIMPLERRMEDIRANIREEKAKLTARGIKIATFKEARRFASLQPEEQKAEMEARRQCYLALGLGEQMQMFTDEADEGLQDAA